jgi:hypothetical protein
MCGPCPVLPLLIILDSFADPTAGKVPTVPFKWKADLALETFWKFWRRINVLFLTKAEFRFDQPPANSLY